MFCRFCGARTDPDDRFCAKCGRRLDREPSKHVQEVVRGLRLNTPYPYAALLFLGFVVWAAQSYIRPAFDYTSIRMELELEDEAAIPEANLFRHRLNLVVENGGDAPIREIPIEFRARVEPEQPAEVVSDFLGRRLVILRNGERLPLVVILSDELGANEKRRYAIDGIVTTTPPAEVIYEVLGEGSGDVLASVHASIQKPDGNGTAPASGLARR